MNKSKIQNHDAVFKSNLFGQGTLITATEKKLEHGGKISSSGEFPYANLHNKSIQ